MGPHPLGRLPPLLAVSGAPPQCLIIPSPIQVFVVDVQRRLQRRLERSRCFRLPVAKADLNAALGQARAATCAAGWKLLIPDRSARLFDAGAAVHGSVN